VVTALKNALMMRKPDRAVLPFRSWQPVQQPSRTQTAEVIEANLSMSGVGNCYDNHKAEAFFSTLKTEFFHPTSSLAPKALARREIFEYIEFIITISVCTARSNIAHLASSKPCTAKRKTTFSKKKFSYSFSECVT